MLPTEVPQHTLTRKEFYNFEGVVVKSSLMCWQIFWPHPITISWDGEVLTPKHGLFLRIVIYIVILLPLLLSLLRGFCILVWEARDTLSFLDHFLPLLHFHLRQQLFTLQCATTCTQGTHLLATLASCSTLYLCDRLIWLLLFVQPTPQYHTQCAICISSRIFM